MKFSLLLLVFTVLSCTHKSTPPAPTKYCLSNVSSSFLGSFYRTKDFFLNEFLLDKWEQPSSDLKAVASRNEDFSLLKNKDGIPLLYKKYDMGSEDSQDEGQELDKRTFVMFSEMKFEKFEAFNKDAQESQKFCFMTNLPLKKDSYPGVEMFFAQDYEVIK